MDAVARGLDDETTLLLNRVAKERVVMGERATHGVGVLLPETR